MSTLLAIILINNVTEPWELSGLVMTFNLYLPSFKPKTVTLLSSKTEFAL